MSKPIPITIPIMAAINTKMGEIVISDGFLSEIRLEFTYDEAVKASVMENIRETLTVQFAIPPEGLDDIMQDVKDSLDEMTINSPVRAGRVIKLFGE